MAVFIGCTAKNNGAGGFYTSNPSSRFIDCEASGNGGPGFPDDSAKALEPFLQALGNDGMPADHLAELRSEIRALTERVAQADQDGASRKYARIVELTANHVTIAAPVLSVLLALISQVQGA